MRTFVKVSADLHEKLPFSVVKGLDTAYMAFATEMWRPECRTTISDSDEYSDVEEEEECRRQHERKGLFVMWEEGFTSQDIFATAKDFLYEGERLENLSMFIVSSTAKSPVFGCRDPYWNDLINSIGAVSVPDGIEELHNASFCKAFLRGHFWIGEWGLQRVF